jgi:fumarylacetoacetate (FAA) hydrolase
VTPASLNGAWQAGRVALSLQTTWNRKRVGLCDCGPEMRHTFGQLIAHLAKTRPLRAGAIIGSGAVANQDTTRGYSSIADKRAAEVRADGEAKTPYLRFGDTLRIEMKGSDGHSIFGSIEQRVVRLGET